MIEDSGTKVRLIEKASPYYGLNYFDYSATLSAYLDDTDEPWLEKQWLIKGKDLIKHGAQMGAHKGGFDPNEYYAFYEEELEFLN